MRGVRSLSALLAGGALLLVAGMSAAVPRHYVMTGKFTSNRGILINIPVVGDTPCAGVGLSNLRIMSGPGLTGHSIGSMTQTMQPNPTPTMAQHQFNQFANGDKKDYQCAGWVAGGKKVVTTGTGVGGAFTIPTKGLFHPAPGVTTAIMVPKATPVIQLATSFGITGPRKVGTLAMSTSPTGGLYMASTMQWKSNWRKFKKNAHLGQPGRVQGAMFTYCWGNPGCTNVTGGTKPVIVKYTGGGNQFGGTMSYVITAGPNVSNLAIGAGGGGLGFALLGGMGSQVTGRGYAVKLSDILASGPLWAMYKLGYVTKPVVGQQKLITMVYGYSGIGFPMAKNYNRGFPWTTMTVLARNTGTVQKNIRATTLTAKGGDTVTAMGQRNISLVAGGIARALIGPVVSNTPEITQMYLPEPSRAAQMLAGVAALLGIAGWRARRS